MNQAQFEKECDSIIAQIGVLEFKLKEGELLRRRLFDARKALGEAKYWSRDKVRIPGGEEAIRFSVEYTGE